MKSRFLMTLALFATLGATSAFALDLHQGRATGVIGEKSDGYVTALTATPEAQALVAEVNGKRQQEYARISGQNGQPTDVVAKLAAQQIINGLPPGSRYQAPDGSWKTR